MAKQRGPRDVFSVVVGGKRTVHFGWRKTDAIKFAKYALTTGAMKACIEKRPSTRGGYVAGRWTPVRCVRRR